MLTQITNKPCKIPSETIQSLIQRLRPLCNNDRLYRDMMRLLLWRERVGLGKYQTTVDRVDVMKEGWIDLALEELLDGMLYFERAGLVDLIPLLFNIYITAKHAKFEMLRGK